MAQVISQFAGEGGSGGRGGEGATIILTSDALHWLQFRTYRMGKVAPKRVVGRSYPIRPWAYSLHWWQATLFFYLDPISNPQDGWSCPGESSRAKLLHLTLNLLPAQVTSYAFVLPGPLDHGMYVREINARFSLSRKRGATMWVSSSINLANQHKCIEIWKREREGENFHPNFYVEQS